jgi:hypothetical protein
MTTLAAPSFASKTRRLRGQGSIRAALTALTVARLTVHLVLAKAVLTIWPPQPCLNPPQNPDRPDHPDRVGRVE